MVIKGFADVLRRVKRDTDAVGALRRRRVRGRLRGDRRARRHAPRPSACASELEETHRFHTGKLGQAPLQGHLLDRRGDVPARRRRAGTRCSRPRTRRSTLRSAAVAIASRCGRRSPLRPRPQPPEGRPGAPPEALRLVRVVGELRDGPPRASSASCAPKTASMRWSERSTVFATSRPALGGLLELARRRRSRARLAVSSAEASRASKRSSALFQLPRFDAIERVEGLASRPQHQVEPIGQAPVGFAARPQPVRYIVANRRRGYRRPGARRLGASIELRLAINTCCWPPWRGANWILIRRRRLLRRCARFFFSLWWWWAPSWCWIPSTLRIDTVSCRMIFEARRMKTTVSFAGSKHMTALKRAIRGLC